MKTKLKVLFLLLCGILVACNSEEEISYVTTDTYLNKNNITDVSYLFVDHDSIDENELLYVCIRKDKEWFAVFNKTNYQLLNEWYGRDRTQPQDGALAVSSNMETRKSTDNIIFLYQGGFLGDMLVQLHKNGKIEYGINKGGNSGHILSENRYFYKGYDNDNLVCDFYGNIIAKNVGFDNKNNLCIGFQGNKLWTGYSKEDGSYKELSSSNEINRDVTLNLGYGEYKNVHIDAIDNIQNVKNYYGYAVVPQYVDKTKNSEKYPFISNIVFLNEQDNQIYVSPISILPDNIYNFEIQNWYKNSIIFYNYGHLFIYNMNGEKIIDTNYQLTSDETLYPINYNETISVGLDGNVKRYSLSNNTITWETWIEKLRDLPYDAKITYTIKGTDTTEWLFQYNYVNKDGSKGEFSFTLDINTGKIEYND